MVLPDFREFRGTQNVLVHSAKGSEWDDHKYVKKIDGVYYYPVGYGDGHTVDELKGGSDKEEKDDKKEDSKLTTDTSGWQNDVKKKFGKMTDKELADMARTDFDKVLANIGIDWRKMPKEEVAKMQRELVGKLDPNGKLEKKQEEKKDDGSRAKEIDEILRKSSGSKKSSSKKSKEKEEKDKKEDKNKKTYSLAAKNRKKKQATGPNKLRSLYSSTNKSSKK